MTLLARLLVVVALCLVAVGSSGASTSATVPGAESDVRLLAQQLEAIHPDLFDSVPRARFKSAVDTAAARADELSENELLVELMRIAALPGNGNGHSGIFPGDPQHRRDLHLYPLRLYAFPDGTYVVDEKGSDGLVGARLTAIGGVSYAEVAKRVRPLVPHDNASNLQGYLPHWVLTAEVLDGLGIADGISPLEFTFVQGGKSRSVTLSPVTVPSYVSTFQRPAPRALSVDPAPAEADASLPPEEREPALGRDPRPRSSGLRGLQRSATSESGARGPRHEALAREAGQARDRRPPPQRRRGQHDVREPAQRAHRLESSTGKGGCSSSSAARPSRPQRTSPPTSTGSRRRRSSESRPAASCADYGDTVSVLLPKSGINVRIAARYWDFSKGSSDRRLAVNPDRKVKVTIADFLAGRDPVLAAALRS